MDETARVALEWLRTLAPCVATALIGWVASARHSRTRREEALADRQRALNDGMLALMRATLMDAYERYVVHGMPLTVARRECIDKEHAAYKSLGGNSTGDAMYRAICELPTFIAGGGLEDR